ncbi:hypothetical protein EDD17DRAFT_756499 [Pisolithus thermaeus]|nr:hypothetical protein EV401DRAFT_1206198 [Pisolithus croceorrhizus]KAI6160686.1 hypothetical protein EDD17DRAFT_756499 [Pisolithus thermaeus]
MYQLTCDKCHCLFSASIWCSLCRSNTLKRAMSLKFDKKYCILPSAPFSACCDSHRNSQAGGSLTCSCDLQDLYIPVPDSFPGDMSPLASESKDLIQNKLHNNRSVCLIHMVPGHIPDCAAADSPDSHETLAIVALHGSVLASTSWLWLTWYHRSNHLDILPCGMAFTRLEFPPLRLQPSSPPYHMNESISIAPVCVRTYQCFYCFHDVAS